MRLRVLICGSRDWPAPWFVSAKLVERLPHRNATILTGGAYGVDRLAHMEAIRLGWDTEVMQADWQTHGKRAGILRNLAMLDTAPDLVLAFHCHGSPGTAHCIREAHRRGIPLEVYTEADLRPDIAALDMGDVE
jgi:YspA, cpYpsA-related SLOG family